MESLTQGISQTVSIAATENVHSARAPVRNEWMPEGNPIRDEWYAAKLSRKKADDNSKLYENRIGMLHKKRERALRMLESTRDRERKLVEMRKTAEAEANHRHEEVMFQNHQQARDHRDARNMVHSARAGCHIKQVLTQDRNTQYKRQINHEKAMWKETRLESEANDFAYRKGIHDYIHTTDVANPRRSMESDKQSKLNRTRDHLHLELADHSKVLSTHDSKMESYESIEHSMIENVQNAKGNVDKANDDLERKYMKAENSYRVDRIVRQRLKEQPLPPDRPHPFTARPG
jgi:hypothetical protein